MDYKKEIFDYVNRFYKSGKDDLFRLKIIKLVKPINDNEKLLKILDAILKEKPETVTATFVTIKSNLNENMLIPTYEEFLNESRITLKRSYTESHPARTTYSNTKVRNRIIETLGENDFDETEMKKLIEEIGAKKNWKTRNKLYFNVKENEGVKRYTLSKFGKRLHEKLFKKINESLSVNDKKEIEALYQDYTKSNHSDAEAISAIAGDMNISKNDIKAYLKSEKIIESIVNEDSEYGIFGNGSKWFIFITGQVKHNDLTLDFIKANNKNEAIESWTKEYDITKDVKVGVDYEIFEMPKLN